jgi:cation-transporting P-type ATPase E
MRPEANDVVAYLRAEGVDLKVMSGDAAATVEAVARAAGFADTTSITGDDLPDDPALLDEVAATHAIFARVSPEQKQSLVEALARRGRYTAMVGDGVNDVPAMKAARVAIALGSGAQIARGVSDIVLIANDFRAIPRGIAEGRRILANIRRVAKLFVVKSAFAMTLILTAGAGGAAYPLLPRHLSLAAFFTIGVPAFALALAPLSGRPPRVAFLRDLLRFSFPAGAVSGLAVILAYTFARSVSDVATGRTVALVVLVLTGFYLVLVLEDDAMQHSRARARSVLLLMGLLLAGFVAVFLIEPVRVFFAIEVLGPVEILFALIAFVFSVGVLGLLQFRIPFVSRRLFG